MADTNNGTAKAPAVGGKQKRSPNYPVIPIDEAIDKVRLIYAKDRRAYAGFNALLEHMGYKVRDKKGGRSARIVATLKQYGLIEDRDGQYRVSEDAARIIDLSDDSPERAEIIRKAAFRPAMTAKVLKHYKGEIPSNTTLRDHLILKEEFNRDSAEEFVKVLRGTIGVVKPTTEDYNAGESSEGEEKQPPSPPGEKPRMQTQQQHTPPPKPPAGQRTYPLYLSKETEGVLYVPSVMSQSEYELLKAQIDSSLKVMLATSVVPDEARENDD